MRWQQPTHRKRKIHQLTQQYDEQQQKHGQREAENKTMRCQGRRRIISPPRAFSAG